MYRHLFWDMGGTLVDTYPALAAALAEVVTSHGGQVELLEVARLTRISTGQAISQLAERFGVPTEEFEAANIALKKRWESQPAPVMPGARELMAEVRAAGGLNLVVTHRDRASATALLDGLGLQVDDLVSAGDGHPRKPDPHMHLVLLERHGLDPADCLAVGDRPIDAVAAHAAGIRAAMLEDPRMPVPDEAEYSVAALAELRPLLWTTPAPQPIHGVTVENTPM